MVSPEHHVAVVERLVESTEPVQRIWPVRVRMALLLGGWSVAAICFAYAWPRPDLANKLNQLPFVIEILALALAAGLTALLALRCAVPGRGPTRIEVTAILALVLIAALALAGETSRTPSPSEGWLCSVRTLAIAALPWSLLLFAIRRGAPVRVTSASVSAGVSSLLLATVMLRTACPSDGLRHWGTWHLAVVPLATALMTPFAARWLQAWRHD